MLIIDLRWHREEGVLKPLWSACLSILTKFESMGCSTFAR